MLKRPVASLIICFAVVLIGFLSLNRLSVSLYPEIASPTLMVRTNYTGASPAEVERLLNIPLEGVLSGVNGVSKVSSMARQGQSLVFVQFNWGQNMDLAFLAIREKLDQVRGLIPDQAERSQIVNTTDANQRIAVLTVELAPSNTNDLSSAAEETRAEDSSFQQQLERKEWVEKVLIRRLEQLEGIAQAIMVGAPQVQVQLKYKIDALQRYNLSLSEIQQAVQSANLFSASGQLQDGWYRYAIKIESRIQRLEDLANSPVKTIANGRVLRINEVADIAIIPEDPFSFARYQNADVLSILLKKTYDANTVDVFKQVQAQLGQIEEAYPNFQIKVVEEAASTIDNSIDNLLQSLYLGGVLAFVVLFLFLNSSRTPFTIGLSIPLSLFATFTAMYLLNIQLNIISLSGLTLGIGLLLDNSIVVLENINRYKKQGYSLFESAAKGSKEIAFAITASTLTTISVFLPLLFLGGFEGAFFRDLSATLSISLLASLLVALFILPVLVLVLNDKGQEKTIFEPVNLFLNRFIEAYTKQMQFFLVHPKRLFAITVLLFIGAVLCFLQLPKEALPATQAQRFSFNVALEGNQSLQASKAAAIQIEETVGITLPQSATLILGGYTDLSSAAALLNEGLNRFTVHIETPDVGSYQQAVDTYEALKSQYKQWQFRPLDEASTGQNGGLLQGDASMVAIELVGINRSLSEQQAPLLEARLQNSFENLRLQQRFPQKVKSFDIRFKADALAFYNLNERQIIQIIESLGNGLWVSQWNRQDEQWPIRLKAPINNIDNPGEIMLPITNRFIPLTELAHFEERSEALQLERNNQRAVLTYATNWSYFDWFWNKKALQEELNTIQRQNNVELKLKGQALQLDTLLADMGRLLLLSVFLIYLILAIQYEDLIYPLLIVLAIPFAWIGSFFGLALFGLSLNTLSFMGMLILTGIAVNDAILKVDFMRRYLNIEGKSVHEAIHQAGVNRFRPVVMTSLTTIFGLIPMMLPIGEGYVFRQALAVSLCGGMFTSTLLTLFVIPLLFERIERFRQNKKDGIRLKNAPLTNP